MTPASIQRPIASSSVALAVACACMVLFLPPMVESTVRSVLTTVFVGGALAVSLFLHWIFVGIAAQRQHRSVVGWVVMSLLFPVGGAAALVLLSWFGDEVQLDAAH